MFKVCANSVLYSRQEHGETQEKSFLIKGSSFNVDAHGRKRPTVEIEGGAKRREILDF